mmetsp:Transcript_10394/g.19392  ORF Transcript_10394/g.19392 Transcript_10394/m.19392 type:complete len:228 (-) Transcript_10394:67-750(-)
MHHTLRYLQGAGGGGGGGGFTPSGGGGFSDGGTGSTSNGIVLIILCVGFVVIAVVGGIQYRTEQNGQGPLPAELVEYINSGPQDAVSLASGVYRGRYQQYSCWHDIPSFTLHIDVANSTCSGYGNDSVGSYKINGLCKGNRLAVQKIYTAGTGNSKENFGHKVLLRLEFKQYPNSSCWGFIGSWWINTNQYTGDGLMQIWQEEGLPVASTLSPEECAQEVAVDEEQA